MTQAFKDTYPIVIVGGGMAGASLALALARQGIECAVFEAFSPQADHQPSFDDRTVALSAASLNIMRRLGLGRELMKVAEPIAQIHVSEQASIAFARLNAEDIGVDQLGGVVENWQLGKVLQGQIKSNSRIDYIAPATVTELQQTATQATLNIEHNGETHTLSTSLVVLADGARSPLRDKLFIDSDVRDFNTSAIVCNVSTQLPHQGCAFERFTTEGPLALLPLTQKRMALVWSKSRANVEQYLSMSEKQFAQALESSFGARLGRITKVGNRQSFPLIQQVSRPLFRGRCVMVGNAAQSLHPIAGQGFNLGLRDISVLSQILGQEYSEQQLKNATEQWVDCGHYALLERYQAARMSDREQTLCVTESLARLFANPWGPLSVSRHILLKALDITPSAKNIFAQQAMGFTFKNSELATNEQ